MMDNQNLDKAMDIYVKLLTGEEVGRSANASLYEEYRTNAQVFDLLDTMLKRSNLNLYEYEDGLFMTAGDKNRIFGFTNEELKKAIGLRLNKELYLAYFIIYHIIVLFYSDSRDMSRCEYVKLEVVISEVTASLKEIISGGATLVLSEIEGNSFSTVAALWDEMPLMANNDDTPSLKAARGSKIGIVKLIFNFLNTQNLFFESGDKYYAKNRFRALVENYYGEHKGRLYEIVTKREEDADASY